MCKSVDVNVSVTSVADAPVTAVHVPVTAVLDAPVTAVFVPVTTVPAHPPPHSPVAGGCDIANSDSCAIVTIVRE